MRKLMAMLIMSLGVMVNTAQADFLGLYVGGGVWDHDATGTFGTVGDDIIDVESDLNYKSDTDQYVWAAFDHFVPFVPNVRIEASSMGHDGQAMVGQDFGGGVNLTGVSSISLDSLDTIAYYRILDNWINLDVGLNIRKIDGDFVLATETVSISETVPMLYVAAQLDMPFSGFSIGGDINRVSYDGSSYQDIRLRAIYEMGVIGFEAGIRSTTIELDAVDTISADLEFEGVMIGAFLHF